MVKTNFCIDILEENPKNYSVAFPLIEEKSQVKLFSKCYCADVLKMLRQTILIKNSSWWIVIKTQMLVNGKALAILYAVPDRMLRWTLKRYPQFLCSWWTISSNEWKILEKSSIISSTSLKHLPPGLSPQQLDWSLQHIFWHYLNPLLRGPPIYYLIGGIET